MSRNSSNANSTTAGAEDMLIGAMLRVPAEAIHRRILHDLNAAGFKGLSLPHIAIFRYPGPDGVRPGLLAERAGMSKQAMNRLLGSLEDLGYLIRSDSPDEGRARIVRFTKRGHAAWAKVLEVLREIEREWQAELGAKDFSLLKKLLFRVWESPLIR
jgi:DNA-binding MarR family transcriptional regulator